MTACVRAPQEPPTVTVLCYHTFGHQHESPNAIRLADGHRYHKKIGRDGSPKKTPYTVSRRRFEEQMRFLAVQRIPVIPLARLIDHLHAGAPLPDRAVVITIDDGYKSARAIAWPVLKRYGFPFTIFVYPWFIDRHKGALRWAELREMALAGVDIQSHSLTHPLLTHPGRAMNEADYQTWIDRELQESKRLIEKHVGRPVEALAYPYGGYDERIIERTRQAGYRAALTCDDGVVTRHTDPFLINRRLVFRETSFRTFVHSLSGPERYDSTCRRRAEEGTFL